MADSIYTFDPVPANNTALDSIPYGPNQLYHNQIDNWFRALASKLAQHVDDLGGVNTVAGTANAITVTLASGITAYATGQLFWFKNTGGPNTTATTMNVNSIGVKEIRLQGDTALSGGELLDNGYYGLLYDTAYDGGDGGFVLLNPSTASVAAATTSAAGIVELATDAETTTGTDTARAVTPANISARTTNSRVILEEQQAQNTAGGTFTSGADRTRVLNTEVYDAGNLCTLSSNQFTLIAGTYLIEWSAPALRVREHQSFLYNVTDTSVVQRGTSEWTGVGADYAGTRSGGSTIVTIATSKAFEIRHRCNTTYATYGLGTPSNFGTEVYTRVEIEKLA